MARPLSCHGTPTTLSIQTTFTQLELTLPSRPFAGWIAHADCRCGTPLDRNSFAAITTPYYRGARGFILAYDVGDIKSFENLKYWLEQIREHADASPRLDIVVAANKCDDSRVAVSPQEGAEFARTNGCVFFEVSAKTGSNIDAMFTCLAELMVRRAIDPQGAHHRPGGVRLPTAEEILRRPSRKLGCS